MSSQIASVITLEICRSILDDLGCIVEMPLADFLDLTSVEATLIASVLDSIPSHQVRITLPKIDIVSEPHADN